MLSKAQIKTIHALRLKKNRQSSGRFLAEGLKVTEELLKGDYIQIEVIYALEEWVDKYGEAAQSHPHVKIVPVSEQDIGRLSLLETPQPVIAVCTYPEPGPVPQLRGKVTLALESVRDPGNLGTIVRIADWFGIERVICSPDCADIFNPKTIQASMGSIARVKVSEWALEEVLAENRQVPVFATVLDGRSITEYSRINEGLILAGNEGVGLSRAMVDAATHRVTIPGKGKAESLNVAVATGIVCSRLLL